MFSLFPRRQFSVDGEQFLNYSREFPKRNAFAHFFDRLFVFDTKWMSRVFSMNDDRQQKKRIDDERKKNVSKLLRYFAIATENFFSSSFSPGKRERSSSWIHFVSWEFSVILKMENIQMDFIFALVDFHLPLKVKTRKKNLIEIKVKLLALLVSLGKCWSVRVGILTVRCAWKMSLSSIQ